MLRHAFKEWAVICQALATGRQTLILRKGGIAESGGVFRPEHSRFWLYPTYLHQQEQALQATAQDLWAGVHTQRPSADTVILSHFVAVTDVYALTDIESALALQPLHLWSPETVQARFTYRQPGLYVLACRVYRVASAHTLAETAAYQGCRTWVELTEALATEPATAVLSEAVYCTQSETLRKMLGK